MYVGIQTISWGSHPDVEHMLREIKEAGYDGVEFYQNPMDLGKLDELYALLKKLRLRLLGAAGGALDAKIDFIRAMMRADNLDWATSGLGDGWRVAFGPGNRRPYIYVDEWRDEWAKELNQSDDLLFALHPHMFKPVQTASEAEAVMNRYPQLRFLPDTAHLTVAGEDVRAVLERNYHRIEAVHLKDWSAVFGRAYQFYSRGFTELGKGDVLLDGVIDLLKKAGYNGWLVVEEDATMDPAGSAQRSRDWLRKRRI